MMIISAILLILPQNSFAYIDPGTGAYVVQTLVAVVGVAVFYVSHPRELIRKVKSKLFKRNG